MGNKLFEFLNRLYSSPRLPWIIIGIGIILRLVRYLHNPFLYFDEASGAVDIIDRPLYDFINPSSDALNVYPFSFLVIVKCSTLLFGNSEYALSLYPLVCGILSLFLFYYVAKHYISPGAVPVALLLFAIMDSLVIYSSIIKPYSSDLFFALLIFAIVIYIQSKNYNVLSLVLFAVSGAIIVWLSNPAVFVLAGVGTSLILYSFFKKDSERIIAFSFICFIWFVSFICFYFIYIEKVMPVTGHEVLRSLKVESTLMPMPPKSLADIRWFIDTFFNTFTFKEPFDHAYDTTFAGIMSFAFIYGCVSMFSNAREKLVILLSPVLFTLAASAIHVYPFKGRLIFFLFPFLLFIIAEGIERLREQTSSNSKSIITIIVILLFIYPISWATYHVKKPFSRGQIKPVLEYIKKNWQDGDIIYVHFFAQYEFEYYSNYHPDSFNFSEDEYVIGIAPMGWYGDWKKQDLTKYYDTKKTIKQSSKDILNEYINDVDKLRGRNRVWLLFTDNVPSTRGINDKAFFLYWLDTKGHQLDLYERGELASVYLYDLSDPAIIKK